MHVFPRVLAPEKEEGEEDGELAPAELCAQCDMEDFEKIVAAKVLTYSAKKRLFEMLREKCLIIEAADQKSIKMEALSEKEQYVYDTYPIEGLREKEKFLTTAMQGAMEGGELTAEEKSAVADQLGGKLEQLEAALEKAIASGKAKAQQSLEQQREKLLATRSKVKDGAAMAAPALKHADEIRKLRVKLIALNKLEKDTGKGTFTIDELKKLGERPELQEAIQVLEDKSRIWFETDEEFKQRLDACMKSAAADAKRKAAPKVPAADDWSKVGGKKR